MSATELTPQRAKHVVLVASSIKRGSKPISLGETFIEWTKEAWRREDLRDSAMVIIRAFPRDFPLMAERGAE